MTASTTCSVAANSYGEKPALTLLQQLTQSLKDWETSGSPKVGLENQDRLYLENLIRPIAMEYDAAPPCDLSPPPGLPVICDDVASSALMDYHACRMPLTPDTAKVTRLCWTIDKAKAMLASGDRIKISPPMDVPLGVGKAHAKFKLMLKPQISSEGKGGASFKRAKGKCYIELKCEGGQDIMRNTQFSFWVGDQAPRGPVEQNFSNDVVGRLPREFELWDLKPSLGHLPRDPEVWGLKAYLPEGCLVLGVEIRVLPSMEAAPCA